MNIVTG